MPSATRPERPSAPNRLAAQRAGAARERIAATQRRRRMVMVGGPVLAIVLVLALLVVVKLAGGSGGAKSGQKATAASAKIISEVTSVPSTVLDKVGVGTIKSLPASISGAALTANGKPRVLYIGAEYCPYCASERWPVVVALSRFGTFAGLGQTTSAPSPEVYPSTATLTFHGATYTSSYVSFTGTETESNQLVNGKYTALDTLSAADQAVFSRLQSNGSIPFIDIGGKYTIAGASYDPAVVHGKSHAQIAAALSDPNSAVAKGVDGTANVLTAAICATTGNRPAAVCTAAGVAAAATALRHG